MTSSYRRYVRRVHTFDMVDARCSACGISLKSVEEGNGFGSWHWTGRDADAALPITIYRDDLITYLRIGRFVIMRPIHAWMRGGRAVRFYWVK